VTLARNTLIIHLLRNGRSVTRSVVKGRNIYTGQDWKCQLVDPSSPVHRQKLLVKSIAGYRINLPIDAAGTFIYQGSTIALEDMVAWGLAKKSKKGYLVQHREGMSADIRIGNATYILEYGLPIVPELVPEPAKQGHLPYRYRFQTPNRTDLTFLTLLTLILLAHIAGVNALRHYPIPEITALKELPRRISRLILEPVAPPPSKVAKQGETGVGEEKPTADVEKGSESEKVKPEAETPIKGDTPVPANREEIRSQVSKMGILGVLTGRGTAGRSRNLVTAAGFRPAAGSGKCSWRDKRHYHRFRCRNRWWRRVRRDRARKRAHRYRRAVKRRQRIWTYPGFQSRNGSRQALRLPGWI